LYGTSAILKAMPGIVSLAALAAVYTFVIQTHERKKAAAPATEMEGGEHGGAAHQGQ
jgi:hypothetical protein